MTAALPARAAALRGGSPQMPAPAVRARQRPALVEALATVPPAPAEHNAPGATVAPMIAPDTMNALRAMAADAYSANLAKNKAAREAEKASKKLEAAMVAAGLGVGSAPILITVTTDSGTDEVEALIDAEAGEAISVDRLREKVTPDIFLKCISATKKAVTEHAGTAVLNDCTVPTEGKPGLKVRKKK